MMPYDNDATNLSTVMDYLEPVGLADTQTGVEQ